MNTSRKSVVCDCMLSWRSEQGESQAVIFSLNHLHDRGHSTGVKTTKSLLAFSFAHFFKATCTYS